ncbi:MAG: hypothetical protein SF028_15635 [Candidatus Sumerlaeia bacterium]|nr:hypothetical protein [Candidatus Sumerlaeia bacterium]
MRRRAAPERPLTAPPAWRAARRREGARLRARGPAILAVLALLWLPANWFFKVWLLEAAFAWPPPLPGNALLALSMAGFVLRPDLFIAIYATRLVVPHPEWEHEWQELRTTALTAADVVRAKLYWPLAFLLPANALLGAYAYWGLYDSYAKLFVDGPFPRIESLVGGLFVTVLAVLEDLLFVAMMAAVALERALAHRGAMLGALQALGFAALFGVSWLLWEDLSNSVAQLLWPLGESALRDVATMMLAFGGPLIAAEAWLLRFFLRRAAGRLAAE